MSMFLRRRLQGYLDDLVGCLSPATVSQLAKGLNSKGVGPLGYEWELLILWGLSRAFTVEYEPGHPNAPKLDVVVRQHGDASPLFTADVRCVSDLGRHTENPVDRWSQLLATVKFDIGLAGGLSWRVEGDLQGEYRDAKMQLRLPDKAAWDGAESRIRSFLGSCKKDSKPKTLDLSDVAPGLVVSFDPRGRGLSGGHPSYTSIYSVRRNPISNALREKRQQRERARTEGLTGTILCDGGCQLLHERHSGAAEVKLRDVVLNYLEDPRAVDFVVTLAVESSYSSPLFGGKPETHAVKAQLFSLRDVGAIRPIQLAFNDLARLLPPAETSAANARAWYASGIGQSGFRRQPMKHNARQISVSARWLMDLLAGRISVEQAHREYGNDSQATKGLGANPFRRLLDDGRLPERIQVLRDRDADDDYVVFDFGEPDPAIAPFRVPK